jgi:tetratricopeptide (TPR) repeat protein
MRLQKADPTNIQLQGEIARRLALLDPQKALPVLQPLIDQNPGDVELMKLFWAIQLRAERYKEAIQTGEQLARLDTSVVDSTFYTRMIAAFLADSQPQRAAEFAGRAVQKYPQSASAHAVFAQTLRRAGQLQQAAEHYAHAVRLDPKIEPGYVALIVTQCELNQADAAFASGQAATRAGIDRATVGSALIGCALDVRFEIRGFEGIYNTIEMKTDNCGGILCVNRRSQDQDHGHHSHGGAKLPHETIMPPHRR